MPAEHFRVFSFAVVGGYGLGLAIAASRAGGIGVVNLEIGQDAAAVEDLLEFVSHPRRGAKSPFGLKVSALGPDLVERISPFVAKGLAHLIVDRAGLDAYFSGGAGGLPEGLSLWAELTDRDRPEWLERIDGIVLKGNEAGGFVGEESAFILFQHWRAATDLPLVVRGGATPHSAAACAALGAAGVVFDSQLLLLPEAGLNAEVAALVKAMSGTETVAVGDPSGGTYFRLLQHPRCSAARAFISGNMLNSGADLRKGVAKARVDWVDPATDLLPLGQEAALASGYAARYGSVARLLSAVRAAVEDYVEMAAANPAVAECSALAQSLGTRLPIIQGPMTRVSDNPRFAAAIAEGGALPMLALAVMKPAQVEDLLRETAELMGARPWGVGFLGFLPQATLADQIEVALKHRPNFAIIAGGRPDQAVALEAQGIPSFLHVPSQRLLGYFIENGARRFIFEGRECGGHIGPMSSFTLWSLMIDEILSEVEARKVAPEELECVFAGGIHDAASSALLQVMVAPLVARGVKVGILMGSAYVFTDEIVATGAILPGFQETLLGSSDTVNLTTGPGHASRCARTPFVDQFFAAQRELATDKSVPEDEKRLKLDSMILGTLRAASKGRQRAPDTGELRALTPDEQYRSGMFMIGQVAALRHEKGRIATLHDAVSMGASDLIRAAAGAVDNAAPAIMNKPADIAIIGLSCALPGAMTPKRFWANILEKHDAVDEIPRHRWDWRLYFDEDRARKDKIYARWGGFLEDMPFDPMRYGITPKSLTSVDPMQLMGLALADEALQDSGYAKMEKALRERTSVVIGASGGSGDVGLQYNLRSELPRFAGDLPEDLAGALPEWSEDTFAGILINVLSGRISNRLDLGGPNFTTDAACASSLAALYQAVNELRMGRSDMAIAGGVDTQQSPFGFMCFAQTGALSPTGRCQTFDTAADGIAISEGIVMFVLKRLEDAEAAGDRIYAVIKGIGSGSDGKAKALNAPEPAGQLRAMKRAYDHAGYTAATVRLFEAHGTGTVAGDTAELESTGRLVAEAETAPRQSVIGSVKTNIGHTKATAGLAGLLKVVLALHYGVLPPHRGVKSPNPVLADPDAPLYLIDDAEPWISAGDVPRRAAVSAFGFGGTNFHATVEAYDGEYRPGLSRRVADILPAELLLLSAPDRGGLRGKVATLRAALAGNKALELGDIAAACARDYSTGDALRAAIVVRDKAGAEDDLAALDAHLEREAPLPSGVTFGTDPADPGKVAILFPGQGSQYAFMGREIATYFPETAETLSEAEATLAKPLGERYGAGRSLSHFLFPRGAYSTEAKAAARKALTSTDIAQPALGAVEAGLWRLLSEGFGLKGDMFAGHSYGEFVAHHAAGALSFADLMRISEARGRLIVEKARDAGSELGTMLAVQATRDMVEPIVEPIEGLVIANHNAPLQVIVSGSTAAIDTAAKAFEANGISTQPIPVAAAFHSELMAPARDALAEIVANLDWSPAHGAVYSNQHAAPHEGDPRAAMVAHLVSPVNFVGEITAMHDAGARIFLEVGPKAVLSRLVGDILEERPHQAIALDPRGDCGVEGLLRAIGQLSVAGVPLNLSHLFEGRDCLPVGLDGLAGAERGTPVTKTTWWVNGSGLWPAKEPRKQIGVTLETVPKAASEAPNFNQKPEPSRPVTEQPRIPVGAQSRSRTATHSSERRSMFIRQMNPNHASDGSVSSAYFELVARSLEAARDVAMAEMGVAPIPSPRGLTDATGARPTHKRVPMRPVPEPRPVTAEATTAPAAVTVPAPAAAAAPASDVPAKTTEAPAADSPLSEADLRKLLLATVAEKTGYEEDMLDFDQNLEADLGIDSIKRVDVVAGMIKALPKVYETSLGDAGRSKLSTSTTLQQMMDIFSAVEGAPANFELAGAGNALLNDGDTAIAQDLPRPDSTRFIVEPVAEALSDDLRSDLTSGHYLIIPDQGGVAAELAGLLGTHGMTTEIMPSEALEGEAALRDWIAANSGRLGELAGLVHLAPLDAAAIDPGNSAPADWSRELFRNEKALFIALVGCQLAETAHVLSASALGGTFGRAGSGKGQIRIAGGAVGLLKSVSREREGLRARAIDLDPTQGVAEKAGQILAELALLGGRIEVGYPEGKRHVFKTVPAAAEVPQDAPAPARVVLATGGARGITAETLRTLAGPGVVLVLTGRSPRPDAAATLRDDPALAALLTEQELARHFVKSDKMPLGDARRKASAILAAREILDNIADLEQRGATVEYLSLNATDNASVAEAVAGVTSRHGAIDAVIHGAGVIEDKFIADVTPDSWDRVVDTKVIGLMLLLKHLDRAELKFVISFSSVAGRYGNAGQTSYATANELINRISCQVQAGFGGTVRSLNWGPWGPTLFGTGMVTPETEAKFKALGVSLVHAELGRDLFRSELVADAKGPVEVICGAAPWEETEAARSTTPTLPGNAGLLPAGGPALIGAQLLEQPLTIRSRDPYLRDHMIDGKPVLAMAMAMEIMAQSVSRAFGDGWSIVAVENARLFNGVIVDGPERDLHVRMEQKSHGMDVTNTVAAKLFSAGAKRPHYAADFVLAPRILAAHPSDGTSRSNPTDALVIDKSVVYEEHLFHGPAFQAIDRVEAVWQGGVQCNVTTREPGGLLAEPGDTDWIFDPLVVDAVAQLPLVWSSAVHDQFVLPVEFGRIERHADKFGPDLVLDMTITGHTPEAVTADVTVSDATGRVVLTVSRMRHAIRPHSGTVKPEVLVSGDAA